MNVVPQMCHTGPQTVVVFLELENDLYRESDLHLSHLGVKSTQEASPM